MEYTPDYLDFELEDLEAIEAREEIDELQKEVAQELAEGNYNLDC